MGGGRRISATYKDLPGGQVLGPTFDYTHRLLDFALAAEGSERGGAPEAAVPVGAAPRVTELLGARGPMQREAMDEANPATSPPALGLPRRAPGALAEPRARRRGLPARAGLFDAARLRQCATPSSARSASAMSRGVTPPELGSSRSSSARSPSPNARWSTSSRAAAPSRRNSPRYGLVFGHGERRAMSIAGGPRAGAPPNSART